MDSALSYRSKINDSSDDDSSNDGDVWKRAPSKTVMGDVPAIVPQQMISEQLPTTTTTTQQNGHRPAMKRKINNIWSNVLEEQSISEDLSGCALKRKPISFQSRGVESYDFTLKQFDVRPNVDVGEGEMEEANDEVADEKPRQLFTKKKKIRLNRNEMMVAQKIVRFLNEPKKQLIERVVHFLGAEKALRLMKMTEDIEDAGGMMILNGERRRTPGGVYFQLLKSDKNITRRKKNEIFSFDHFPGQRNRRKPHKLTKRKGATQPAKDIISLICGVKETEKVETTEKCDTIQDDDDEEEGIIHEDSENDEDKSVEQNNDDKDTDLIQNNKEVQNAEDIDIEDGEIVD